MDVRNQRSYPFLQVKPTTLEGRTSFCLVKKTLSSAIDAMGAFIRDMEWIGNIGGSYTWIKNLVG